jgi:hypothetical protein
MFQITFDTTKSCFPVQKRLTLKRDSFTYFNTGAILYKIPDTHFVYEYIFFLDKIHTVVSCHVRLNVIACLRSHHDLTNE